MSRSEATAEKQGSTSQEGRKTTITVNVMGQQNRIAAGQWTWPEQLATYDKRPDLSELEATTLAKYARQYRECRTQKTMDFRGTLDRLIGPLEDVFSFTETRRYWRSLTIFFMLREMARRNRSYWAWSKEEWIETMAARKGERQHVIAAAYLLCGFSSLEQVTETHLVYSVLAKKVFGREHIEQILDRLNNKLDQWGYARESIRMWDLSQTGQIRSDRLNWRW
jgi:hypothetical protein